MNEAGLKIRAGLRGGTPLVLGVMLALASLLPFGMATAAIPAPHLTLIHVHYWSIHRPHLMPLPAVAGLGLLQDLIWGGPPGLNMLVLLTAQAVLSNQQALFTRRSFTVGWMAFMAVVAIAAAVSWSIASLYYEGEAAIRPVAEQALLTVAAYPPVGWILGRIDRALFR